MNYRYGWIDLKREPETPTWKKALGGICILLILWALTAFIFCL